MDVKNVLKCPEKHQYFQNWIHLGQFGHPHQLTTDSDLPEYAVLPDNLRLTAIRSVDIERTERTERYIEDGYGNFRFSFCLNFFRSSFSFAFRILCRAVKRDLPFFMVSPLGYPSPCRPDSAGDSLAVRQFV